MNTQVYYPSYLWAYILSFTAFMFSGLWIALVVLGLTPPSPEFPQAGSMGPAIVLGIFWIPMIVLFFDISLGLFRSRVKLTEQGLDLCTTSFAIWRLRRVYRIQLEWNDVWGVQVWGQTNAMANPVTKTQIDYIIHTAYGKYCVTDLVWPQAREIGEAIALRIGRPLNDIQAGVPKVDAKRPQDIWGLKILHGLGFFSTIIGCVLCLLGVLSLLAGNNFKDSAIVVMFGAIVISLGESLRRYRMQEI